MKKTKNGKIAEVPIDEEILSAIWTKVVKEQFPNVEIPEKLDVHIHFTHNERHYFKGQDISLTQLLHWLRYKNRHPLIDLSMTLRERGNDVPKERIEWVKKLIQYKNHAIVLGYWKWIKRLCKFYPEKEIDGVNEMICPICGGVMSISCPLKTNKLPDVDNIVIKFADSLQIFKRPPPDLIKKQQTIKDFIHSPESSEEYIPRIRDKILKNFETGKRYTYDQLNQRLTDSEIEKSLFDGYIFRINTQTYGVV